jgi:uncharacterized phage protein gp47/JayE
MAGPFPLSTLGCTISATGITAPTFSDILASLQASFQGIYGSDVVLDASSQDGQWLAVIASAINDANAQTIAVFNAFSPSTAQGAGLSSVVKINGLLRESPSNSSADLTIVGQAGTPIAAGLIGDNLGNKWALPANVTIPPSGQITETAVCTTAGAITAGPGTIINILNPTKGWQTATNPASATVGAPVEPDATLRKRQSVSTSLPALSVLDAIIGQIANLPGVEAWAAYENDTSIPDGNGVPDHAISLVVEGGDSVQIATTIATVKTPGTGTFGTTSEMIIDPEGVPNTIQFFRPSVVRIVATVTLTPLTGYVSTTGAAIAAALAAYVSGLAIGANVDWSRLFVPANLNGGPLSATFNISSITLAIFGNPQASADVPIAFNAVAALAAPDVTVNV